MLLDCHTVPDSWKRSTIIPVPKKSRPQQLNDYRPIALTSILAKCMEKIVRKHLLDGVASMLDPLQFAYRARRGVEDASVTLLNLVSKHLEDTQTYARILFIDFSSAFNTIEPCVLIRRLISMDVNSDLVLWICDFLTDRPQRVCVSGHVSDEVVLNTGAPQGCVLSPTLFSIYTDHMRIHTAVARLFKFADDMALVQLLKKEDCLAEYFSTVSDLTTWCQNSFLELNVSKTKELCIGNEQDSLNFPVLVEGEPVEVVTSFKYLGTFLDSTLSFDKNTDMIVRKANQRLYLLRKLKSFNVSQRTLQMVYRSLVESVLTFNLVAWYGNLTVRNKNKLSGIVNTASKIVGCQLLNLADLYRSAVKRKALSICTDPSHPLHEQFQMLPLGRRYRVPLARKNRFKHSFVPSAVKILNS